MRSVKLQTGLSLLILIAVLLFIISGDCNGEQSSTPAVTHTTDESPG